VSIVSGALLAHDAADQTLLSRGIILVIEGEKPPYNTTASTFNQY